MRRWRRFNHEATSSAALRSRLLERARASREETQQFVCVRVDDGTWRPVVDGVRMKLLNSDPTRSVLLELDAGAVLPTHRHHENEECVVLRGSVQMADLHVGEGDYHLARAGSRHGTVSSPAGALLYLRCVPLGSNAAMVRSLITAWLPGKGSASLTVRTGEGEWQDLRAGVQSKQLWSDGTERSMLLRLQPGACVPGHSDAREECLVVDGEAFFGDTLLRATEYQFAASGTAQRDVYSDVGALLYVHTVNPA